MRCCSAECERRSYYEGRRDKDHAKEEAEEGIPLREFQCEYWGDPRPRDGSEPEK